MTGALCFCNPMTRQKVAETPRPDVSTAEVDGGRCPQIVDGPWRQALDGGVVDQ